MTCNAPPETVPQLKTGLNTRGADCGPVNVLVARNWASCGRFSTRGRKSRNTQIRDVRDRMGKPSGSTTIRDQKRALESYAPMFEAAGLTAPKLRLINTWQAAVDALKAGHLVVLSGWYKPINEAKPSASGSRSFNDFHAFSMVGTFTRNGNLWTTVVEGLQDGRLVTGPQPIPLWVMKQSAAGMRVQVGGKLTTIGQTAEGAVIAGVVKRSRPLPVTEPAPDPDPRDERIARLTTGLVAATNALGQARSALDEVLDVASAAREDVTEAIAAAQGALDD